MKQILSMRLERRQVMAFALHQALRILQLPQQELAEWIQGEIERNPFLEQKEAFCHPIPINSFSTDPPIQAIPSFREHLLAQVRESFSDKTDLQLAMDLIDHLDPRGWLTSDYEHSHKDFNRVLAKIQTFDPPGIGARNLQESLLIQLRAQPYSLAEILIRDYFQDLLAGRFKTILKQLDIIPAEFQQALQRISRLRMHPATAFDHSSLRPLVADLVLKEIDQGWLLEAGEEELPLFHLRTDYINLYRMLRKGEEKETMRSWLTSAKWLQRCLKRRRETLRSIGRLLIRRQISFFKQIGPIIPIKIQELAQLLNVHETTAWRAIVNKILACPCGMIPLQQFFSESMPANATKEFLRRCIAEEDKTTPFTDEELVQKLQEKQIFCARRTVAKYRRSLHIGPAAQRRATGQ